MTKIITDNCDGCGECVDACSNSAITIEDNNAVINKELCLGCGVCIGACPNEAIVPDSMIIKIQDTELKPRTRPRYRPTNIPTIKTTRIHRQPLFFYPRNIPIRTHYHYRSRKRLKRGRR